jgi:glycosyltransferase involved in cell wall biosynthesis
MTKFSIIVVAYQRYKEIKCLLHSLLSQTYDNFEVIVLHDGHDEQHANIMSEFLTDDRFKYTQTPTRFNDWGMSLRNIGLEMVTGDYVINTNDDNYYTPNWLNEVNLAIEENPEINFVYYDMVLSHNNIENHNKKDYGLFIPQLRHSYIDMGQFAVKSNIIAGHKFSSNAPADGELIEEIKHKLNPYYINKILFVHN